MMEFEHEAVDDFIGDMYTKEQIFRRKRKRGHGWSRKKRRRSSDKKPTSSAEADNALEDMYLEPPSKSSHIEPEPWKKYLEDIYYDPSHPGSYQGLEKLMKQVRSEGLHKISSDKVKQWLQDQPSYSLNKRVRLNFNRAQVITSGKDDQFEMDLLSLEPYSESNDGYKYLLVVIDAFSRYAWVRPLKDKTANRVIIQLKDIFKEGRLPRRVRTDRGSEFTSSLTRDYFKDIGVSMMFSSNEKQANFAERFVKTIKSRIHRYMTAQKTRRYIDVLQDFVQSYNNTEHRSIEMAPSEVDETNEKLLWWNLYSPGGDIFKFLKEQPDWSRKKAVKFQLNVGDLVRISHRRKSFQREYDSRWSREIFRIVHRFKRQHRALYEIEDLLWERIKGTFTKLELQKVTGNPDRFLEVTGVTNRRSTSSGGQEVFVTFAHLPKKFNRWMSSEKLERILQSSAE